MSDNTLYHDGSRRLQDRFETRRLADRLEEVIAHVAFTDGDRAFIESRPMFFLATADAAKRLRVNGRASIREADPLLAEFVGAQVIVRVEADAIFPNCPRYVHKMQMLETSPYAPAEGHTPPVPEWKTRPVFREVLPPGDPAAETRPDRSFGRLRAAGPLISRSGDLDGEAPVAERGDD